MKIKRCALAAAVVMAVCAVVLLCWNRSVPETGTVVENSAAPVQAAVSATPTTVAALAAPVAEPASNQMATVRGTKPYVLTCEGHFNKALRRAAEALGVKTVEVLSRNSLLVEADSATVARVRASGKFSVEREFLPSDKIAPALADRIAGGAEAVEVAVVTLSADDHRRVQGRVVSRGGEILTGCFNEGTTFRARMPASLVSELASFGDVRWMEVFVRPQILNDRAIEPAAMNVSNAWVNLSLSGAGQSLSTSDSGIDLTHLDLASQVLAHKVVEGCADYDANGHGTHTAGSIAGDGTCSTNQIRGSAWGAKLYAWFCGKDNDNGIYTPTTKAELFRGDKEGEGEAWDVYIHSASWGSAKNGEYDAECADLDKYVWENSEFLPVFAAGNEGPGTRTISSPAAAKNVLTVGATQNLRREGGGKLDNGDPTQTAEFSSRGPCKDGRTKPDIAAPGVGVLSTRAYNQKYSYGEYAANTNYAYDTGTSMATPLTAGAVALVRQWLMKRTDEFADEDGKRPTAALMKAIVTGGAKDAAQPSNDQGWGRIDVMETLAPSNRAVKLIDRIPFADGEDFTWVVETTNDAPFDVQLAWIDFPGAASTSQSVPKLVNDLDLTVQSFDEGTIHYGNGGDSADTLNTLESVRIKKAATTRYYVTVSCPTVFADYTEGGAAALYIRGAFDPETIEPYWTARIVRPGAETNTYFRLEKALNEAVDGDVIEILDRVDLRESVTLTNDFALTLVATNANPRLSPIVRRNGADILVTKGSLFFTNTVFQTESTTPVRVSKDGVVKVAGIAVFDDIVSRTPGVLTDRPEGFVLAGRLDNGITVDCTGKSQPGDRFGVYTCDFEAASNSAPRLISASSDRRAGVAEEPNVLKWADDEPVDPAVAVAYVAGDEPVYYRTLDQLFDETNGNVVITKSGIGLRTPRTLTGVQSISADADAGEIVVYPDGSAGFTVGAGCDLTVSGITFRDYTGNGLFVVNGADAKLTVSNSVFRNIEGTNKWSGAIAVLKGHVSSVNTDYADCRATGDHWEQKAMNPLWVTGKSKSYGGAIYLEGEGCELELDGSRITGCSARTGGGGIYAKGRSVVGVCGALTVKGNSAEDKTKLVNDIELENTTAELMLVGKLDGTDSVGVRYGASSSDKGNDLGKQFAAVADGADYASSLKAFFNDTNPDGMRAVADETGDKLCWAKRTPGDRNVDPDDVDATVRVTKGGVTQWYVEPEYAFGWIKANETATVEILTNAVFGADLVVTNGATVTLMSTNVAPYALTRRGETEIRVLAGASLTVTNAVLDGNGAASTIGFVKVEGEKASLELQAGATVRNVRGSADRASGAISVQKGGTFTMRSGAEIVDCWNNYVNAGSKSGYGGGLLVEENSTANLFGGSIEDCRANRGAGVFIGTKSTVNIAGDMKICWNYRGDDEWDPEGDNLCVADQSELCLVGPLTEQSLICYNEGRSGDTNVFGKVVSDFSGTAKEIQTSAHRFRHDFTGDVGMAVSNGSETLLVWGSALDADGKYQEGDKTYLLVNGGEPLYKISVPIPAVTNFTYDGTAKTCVREGIGYRILSGNVATNVGNYVAVVTTCAGFVWKGGATGETNIAWQIKLAQYVLKGVTFEDTVFEYDGTMKYLALTGTLPDGLSVEYLNNGRWQPGTNEVTAVIFGSVPNYEPDPFTTNLCAKLIIVDAKGLYRGETDQPEPEPEYTVTTNDPSMTPLAFSNIVRIAENEWQLSLTNLLKDAEYALSFTDDLTTPFKTGEWFTAESDGLWTTNWIFTAEPPKPAYFWRAHGRTTYVTNWPDAVQPQPQPLTLDSKP